MPREFDQMASATLCFTGFSRDEMATIQNQFDQANAALANRWSLTPEADARVLVIDMDSMYGHMTWLKAQGTGKVTVGATAGERSETDHLLRRPFSSKAIEALLKQLDVQPDSSAPGAVLRTVPTPAPTPAAAAPTVAEAVVAAPAPAFVVAPTPVPTPAKPEPITAAAEPPRTNHSADYLAAVTTGQMAATGPTVPHELRISDYLSPGRLGGPAKVRQLDGAPVLAFDPGSQTYAGSATLKPLLPYVDAVLADSDLLAIDAAEFDSIKAASGGAQPYMRLLWLCGLTVARGILLPGYSNARKFQLTKWPQVEREYPKHFRLATVMMKGPAQVKEIAEASGVTEQEVIDFVNAGLITGAVVVEGAASSPADVAKACALLAKPRAG